MQQFIIRFFALIFIIITPEMLSAQTSRLRLTESMERAQDLFDKGHWADARNAWMTVERLAGPQEQPEREIAAFHLAVCAVELGRPDAETALLEFETRYPGSLRTNDIRFARASHYCTHEAYDKALETFEQVDYGALSPDNRNRYDIRRGYIDFAAEDYDAAYNYFERVDKQSTYADHACYYMAYIDYTRGDYDRAREGFTHLLTSENYRTIAPFFLLQLEFRQQNYPYVVEHGDELIATASQTQQRDLLRMISEAWFHMYDYAKAYEYMAAYREAGGEFTRDASYIEGFSLYRLARYIEASNALRRVAGPADALTQNAAYHLADCYLRMGNKKSAMQAFAMATDKTLSPEVAEDALYNYGKLRYELGGGNFNEAINILSRYHTEYPNSERADEINVLLAAAYYNSENYDAAYEAIRTLPSPDSDMRAARQKITYFRALKQLEAGDLEAADHSLKESAEIGVSARFTALAGFWRGEIAFARNQYDAATGYFERFRQQAPNTEREYTLASYNLGYCHLQSEQFAEAEKHFSDFLRNYPTNDSYRADALNREGDSRYRQRKFEEALKSYEAAAASGWSARYYGQYQQAITLGILGNTEQKIDQLKEIVAADRGDYADDATYELGRTYIGQKRYSEGAVVLKKFVARYPHSPHYTTALSDLGLIYANLGDKKQSMNYYDQVVKRSPTSAEARGALQGIRDLYLDEGNVEGYIAYAEQSGIEGELSAHSRDSLSFTAAQNLYLANRIDDAARSLRSYVKSFPKGFYLSDALYYLSNCYREQKDATGERETLQALTETGESEYTTEALQRLAPLAFDAKEYATAANAYGRLSSCAPTAQERSAYLEGYVRSTITGGDQEAVLALAAEVESHPEASPKALREARFAKAQLLDERGERREAQALYDKLRTEVRTAEGAEAMYRTILAHMEEGKWKEVEEFVFTFAEMPSPHNYWLAKSFLLLGDCYLKQNDTFQARATWQSVADGYSPADDGIVSEAKARINQLKN